MAKTDKKRAKLEERIKTLQDELTTALTKKTSNTKEISVSDYQRKIAAAKLELSKL